jgi:N-acetylmuramoyl-L-alanine amidase
VGQFQPRVVRLVIDLKQNIVQQQFTLPPVAAYQHRLVFDLYPLQEADPLLGLIRDKETSEKQAAKALQDALGELISKIDKPAAAPAVPATTTTTPTACLRQHPQLQHSPSQHRQR